MISKLVDFMEGRGNKNTKLKDDLVYPDLSYKIVGILFDVYNELGPGFQEKYYQRAVKEALKKENLFFQEQVFIPLKFQGKSVGQYFLDFLIDNKIVLELKVGD